MATPPDFSAGSALTAAQMDGIGLWRLNTTTIAASPASTTTVVSNVFTADYDNYLIHITGVKFSVASTDLRLVLGATITDYNQNGFYTNYAAATLNGYNNPTAAFWPVSFTETGTAPFSVIIHLFAPYRSEITRFSTSWATSAYTGVYNGFLNNTTSYTDFTISAPGGAGTGTHNSGKIITYGYNSF